MIDSTEKGDKVITVQEKTFSQNVQLAALSGQEVSKILGQQPPIMTSTGTTPQVIQMQYQVYQDLNHHFQVY